MSIGSSIATSAASWQAASTLGSSFNVAEQRMALSRYSFSQEQTPNPLDSILEAITSQPGAVGQARTVSGKPAGPSSTSVGLEEWPSRYSYHHQARGATGTKNKEPVQVQTNQEAINGLLLLILLLVLAIFGSMGDVLIVSALTVIESLQTRGNCYLVSLALAHLLVNLFVIPSSAVQIMAGDQVNSDWICHHQWLLMEFSLIVSQLTYLLIAIESYLGLRSFEKVTTQLAGSSVGQSADELPKGPWSRFRTALTSCWLDKSSKLRTSPRLGPRRFGLANEFEGVPGVRFRPARCLNYPVCCGYLKVLAWLALVWLLALGFSLYRHRTASFGPQFCAHYYSPISRIHTGSKHLAREPETLSPVPLAARQRVQSSVILGRRTRRAQPIGQGPVHLGSAKRHPASVHNSDDNLSPRSPHMVTGGARSPGEPAANGSSRCGRSCHRNRRPSRGIICNGDEDNNCGSLGEAAATIDRHHAAPQDRDSFSGPVGQVTGRTAPLAHRSPRSSGLIHANTDAGGQQLARLSPGGATDGEQREYYYWPAMSGLVLAPSLIASLLFGRAYARMKRFRFRSQNPLQMRQAASMLVAPTLSSNLKALLLSPHSPTPLLASTDQAYAFPTPTLGRSRANSPACQVDSPRQPIDQVISAPPRAPGETTTSPWVPKEAANLSQLQRDHSFSAPPSAGTPSATPGQLPIVNGSGGTGHSFEFRRRQHQTQSFHYGSRRVDSELAAPVRLEVPTSGQIFPPQQHLGRHRSLPVSSRPESWSPVLASVQLAASPELDVWHEPTDVPDNSSKLDSIEIDAKESIQEPQQARAPTYKTLTLCSYPYITDDQLLRSNIIAFGISLALWVPFVVLCGLSEQHQDGVGGPRTSLGLRDSVWWLATLNCCSCSYVYALTNRDFREAFNKLFYYCCCKSHVTFSRKTPIFRHQFDVEPDGNLRVHIIPGINVYWAASQQAQTTPTSHSQNGARAPVNHATDSARDNHHDQEHDDRAYRAPDTLVEKTSHMHELPLTDRRDPFEAAFLAANMRMPSDRQPEASPAHRMQVDPLLKHNVRAIGNHL